MSSGLTFWASLSFFSKGTKNNGGPPAICHVCANLHSGLHYPAVSAALKPSRMATPITMHFTSISRMIAYFLHLSSISATFLKDFSCSLQLRNRLELGNSLSHFLSINSFVDIDFFFNPALVNQYKQSSKHYFSPEKKKKKICI